MKQCLMLKLIMLIAVLVIPAALYAAGDANPPAKETAATQEQAVDMQFTDTPLPVALDAMFKGTGKSYVLDPGLTQFRVKAVLRNITFDTALTQMLSALGAAYYVGKEGIYHISIGPQQQVTTPQSFGNRIAVAPTAAPQNSATLNYDFAQQPRPEPSGAPGAAQTKTTTQVINTKYINAAEAANAVANTPGVASISATNGQRLVIEATPEAMQNASQVIAGLDTDKALPKPIRLRISARITVGTPKGPRTYQATTESVGAEQLPALLDLETQDVVTPSSNAPMRSPMKPGPPQLQKISLISASIVPSINPDGRIGLVGRGSFSFPVGIGPGSLVSKDFGVAASVPPGSPFIVASGSMTLETGKADFAVTITATPEEGRVYMSPSQYNAQQGGDPRPNVPPPASVPLGPPNTNW